jgi:hypothetical protein
MVRRRFKHRPRVFSCAFALLSWSLSGLGQASQPLAAQPSSSQAPAGHDGCRAYFTIAPLDQNVLKLLGTPIEPANEGLAASSGFRRLRAWDFPSKVTPWSARPSPDELSRRAIELSQAARSVLISNPYYLQTSPPRDWNDLEKWFRKEAPRKLPGACVDSNKAMYVVVVGVILDGSADGSLRNSSARNEYKQSAMARQQDSSVGANAATVPPVPRIIRNFPEWVPRAIPPFPEHTPARSSIANLRARAGCRSRTIITAGPTVSCRVQRLRPC